MLTIFRYLFILVLLAAASCSSDSPETQVPDQEQETDGTQDGGTDSGEDDNDGQTPSVAERISGLTDLVDRISTEETYTLTDNVSATELHYTTPDGSPIAMFVFEAKLAGGVTVTQTTPYDEGPGNGLQRVTEQALEVDAENAMILGGTNADFFMSQSYQPQGVFHHKGHAVKTTFASSPSRSRSFFYITRTGLARTAPASEYAEISASNQIYEACGGGPVLVSGGEAIQTPDPDDLSTEPRTCVGATEDGKTVYLMVIDGRQETYSVGMDFSDMAKVMEALGCWSAINLDGGGSSTFYIRTDTSDASFSDEDRFEILNSPSDGQERAVWNGLAIIQRR